MSELERETDRELAASASVNVATAACIRERASRVRTARMNQLPLFLFAAVVVVVVVLAAVVVLLVLVSCPK